MVSVGAILLVMGALLTAIMAFLSIATIAIGAAICGRAYLLAMTTMFLVSALVRYGISVDYKATLAICFAMGLAPWIRESVIIVMLLCIHDIFEYTIRNAIATSSVTTSSAGHTSDIIMMAMKKISQRRIYQVVVVVGVLSLYIYMTLAAIFVVCASMIACGNLLSISVVLAVSNAMHSPVVLLYYLVCFLQWHT